MDSPKHVEAALWKVASQLLNPLPNLDLSGTVGTVDLTLLGALFLASNTTLLVSLLSLEWFPL